MPDLLGDNVLGISKNSLGLWSNPCQGYLDQRIFNMHFEKRLLEQERQKEFQNYMQKAAEKISQSIFAKLDSTKNEKNSCPNINVEKTTKTLP